MTITQLREKANRLPLQPGVYLMEDRSGKVIYVGKAKKLKNRVSQYFQDTASHNHKTRLMVSCVHDFRVILAATEFEALVLECSLIKQHMPKYNILLKDDKGYPYLRLDMKDPFPQITMVSKIADDGAAYYGPFGSRAVTQSVLNAIRVALRLPGCTKQFPKDAGKGRPCLNYHMDQCAGWCQRFQKEEYLATMEQARKLLTGHYKQVAAQIRQQMLDASDSLNFELAAQLRNRLQAVEALGKKQTVTAGAQVDTDVIGFASTESRSCFTVLHYSGGQLLDKDYEVFPLVEDADAAVSSLLKQYYLQRGFAPKRILLPFPVEDLALFEFMLLMNFGCKTKFHVPQRGSGVSLIRLAETNAREEAVRVTGKEEKLSGTLQLLGKLLSIEPPSRIESYDISHVSGTDMVGSMVVFCNGRPAKSEYKRFKLKDMIQQDDYAAMEQVLRRRFTRLLDGDTKFTTPPDLLLIDGGSAHANVAQRLMDELNLSIPVYGMVKDDRHRTRALITASGQQVGIDQHPAVFAFIGNIQEQTHGFAIHYHRKLRSKRLRYSKLDTIAGIGPKRKEQLLQTFRSIKGISQATLQELERILPKDAALAVYQHFHME